MARNGGGLRQVMVRMPRDMHAEVSRLAGLHDLSMAQAVRAAIRQWVADPKLSEVPELEPAVDDADS